MATTDVQITVTFDGKDRFEQGIARIEALLDECEALLVTPGQK